MNKYDKQISKDDSSISVDHVRISMNVMNQYDSECPHIHMIYIHENAQHIVVCGRFGVTHHVSARIQSDGEI